ncbi:glycoside hydrolase family 2 TIM barrel-domain containing protein [Tamlana sp. 2201CG12-4]|uniref:glycoside hydrolase family 2 protein n=1 Tax=Tamlana sp. 2201CG12-4 TaxID=3112582 RepID=UPI002DBD6748|nr:glycoside hydrolase family 2 TIM barrel-domain containing protein [Tamlana sp. 2201CG12-4]MEC3908472.1 glycoside hydrolase family 2 TIM barrel-domain containing protein [Tamlana sp. 2201CG12-4]
MIKIAYNIQLKRQITLLLMGLLIYSCATKTQEATKREIYSFNQNWKFKKQRDENWKNASLPHTANIEPAVIDKQQWQGNCWYRKRFKVDSKHQGKHIALYFEGAMQLAEVWLNDKLIMRHDGGYLPFYVELTDKIYFDKENVITVKLNNEDNLQVPPGKPIAELDFNWFSGLYRNVHLIIKDKIHITHPIQTNIVAGGGVFVQTLEATANKAKLNIKTDILNDSEVSEALKIQSNIYSASGKLVQTQTSQFKDVLSKESDCFVTEIDIENPDLWSPESPELYTLKTFLLKGNIIVDSKETTFGIRSIKFDKKGFYLNGKKYNLRGTNRHQEYPYIGYALSDNAQYRDAYKIKQAGFNFVRLSHYPQSESFMKACDKLGLLVMDAIPGWQFFGDETFQENCYKDIRQVIRRDRNHPCVILWEASLNESDMSKPFMDKAHAIVHEEFPGNQTYSCGWIDYAYDIFIPARQHATAPDYWKKYDNDRPLLIAEYGDWEYYAQNAGFNQTAFSDLKDNERNSRQLRAEGQKCLAQQAYNYQESHNDNLYNTAAGDANWLMFDYNRGYAPDIESSGIMDIFRLPKFAYYFYSSQQVLDKEDPVLFIANYWNDPSYNRVKIYSNCDTIELWLNGKRIEKRQPDTDKNSTNLKHPPFTFKNVAYQKGTLTAKGFANGKQVAETSVTTPEKPAKIELFIDKSNKPLQSGCNDAVFIYAKIMDKNENYVPLATNKVKFDVEGDAELIGDNPSISEAGIATILLKGGTTSGIVKVSAISDGLEKQNIEVFIEE